PLSSNSQSAPQLMHDVLLEYMMQTLQAAHAIHVQGYNFCRQHFQPYIPSTSHWTLYACLSKIHQCTEYACFCCSFQKPMHICQLCISHCSQCYISLHHNL